MQRSFLENLGIDTDKIDIIISETEKIKSEFDAVKNDYDNLVSSVRTEKIEQALKNAGAKNIASVQALIDFDSVTFDGLEISGLDEQINSIRENNDFLFSSNSVPHIVDVTKGTDNHDGTIRKVMGL